MDDFSGIGTKMPLACLALVMAGLSFAGVPPFGGFIGKYLVFTAAIEANLSWLAVIGVLTSVLQAAYIFRLIYIMYGKKSKNETAIKESKQILIPIFILAGSLIILGLFPSIVLNLIHPVVHQLQGIIPTLPSV
jgi:NADH-quinone oxidoreductase subunit N